MDKFKVGDEVKVIGGCFGDLEQFSRRIGNIESVDNTKHCAYRIKGFEDTHNFAAIWSEDDLELTQQTMTLKEAMKLCIDGAKVCFEGSQSPKNHMKFDGKNFVYFEDGEYEVVSMVLHQTQWKLWTEPETPPCFKPRQLIRNATGDIGFVVSDEGVKKGIRRYKVCFNAVEDSPLKNYDESMLYGVIL